MKKQILSACLLVAVSATLAFAAVGDPKTGVVGSVHDMRAYGGSVNDTQDRVCAYCHTPHHADTVGNDYLPLWSHDISGVAHTAYWSSTITSISEPGEFLMGPSKLCMSCHDGSIAVDQHYNIDGTVKLSGDDYLQPNVGDYNATSLSNDHPIGFLYSAVAGATANTAGTDTGGVLDNYINKADANLAFIGNPTVLVKDRLYGAGYMTCATCHDVHNKKNADLTGTQNYLVLAPQSGSQLCLTCHVK